MFGLDFINLPLAGTPYGTALEVCLVLAFVAWLLSVITREVSWMDRLWSICPPVYCLIVAFATDFQFARVNVMTLLVVLWGARLTYNFARKGGYRPGGEDYRWATVREKAGPVGFQVLSITFVHPGQMVLLWLFASPIHRAWAFGDLPLNRLDFVAAGLFFLLLVGQTVADRQQWDFQQDKKRRIAAGEEAGTAVPHHRALPLQPAPELLLRDRDVVRLLPVRGRGFRRMAALDRARLHRADPVGHPVPAHDRAALGRQVPRLPRLPGDDFGFDSAPAEAGGLKGFVSARAVVIRRAARSPASHGSQHVRPGLPQSHRDRSPRA